jgi:hypothetical protein
MSDEIIETDKLNYTIFMQQEKYDRTIDKHLSIPNIILESLIRLNNQQMIVKDCQHIWNAHGQCQWCHGMKRDYDIMIVSEYFRKLYDKKYHKE